MTGYVKGTTPGSEMRRMHEAFAQTCAAIYAWPDAAEARDAAVALGDLTRRLQSEAAAFRGWLAVDLVDRHGFKPAEVAAFLGVSRPRVYKMLAMAREKGNPVTDPTTLPELPHVVLAVVTSDRGVLVEQRRDGIPPWTFPGGEIAAGESSGDAAKRRVRAETGLAVASASFIGRRLHPKTSRVMVYLHVTVEDGEPALGDPEDLAEVRWMSIDETRTAMPDMYGPVRQYLDELQRAQAATPR